MRLPDFVTCGALKWLGCQPYAPAAFITQEIFLVLISVRIIVNARTIVQQEGLWQSKIPVTPTGIEPATLGLVTNCATA